MEHKSESFFRKSFEKGVELYCSGQDEAAAACLSNIALNYPRAFLFLAVIEKRGIVKTAFLIPDNIKIDILSTKIDILKEFISPKDGISIHIKGLYYFVREYFDEAASCFEKAAKAGDEYAQYYLGLCYLQGKGKPQNLQEAADHFYAAALKGHEQATFHLGICCINDQASAQKYGGWYQRRTINYMFAFESIHKPVNLLQSQIQENKSTSSSISAQAPADPLPEALSKRQLKKGKKSPKQEMAKPEIVSPPNDHKVERPPILSISEAQSLLNQAIQKPLDTQNRKQLKEWFGGVKDEKVENLNYWFGLYCECVAKKQDEAAKYYEKVLAADSKYAEVQYRLGKYHENTKPKNRPKALACYEKAKENGYQLAEDACKRLRDEQDQIREHKKARALEEEQIRKQKEAQVLSVKKAAIAEIPKAQPVVVEISESVEVSTFPITSPKKEVAPNILEAKSAMEVLPSEEKTAISNPPKIVKQPKSAIFIEGEKHFNQGRELYRLGSYHDALLRFEQATKLGYWLGHLYWGLVLEYSEKNNPQAKICFTKAKQQEAWYLEQPKTPQRAFYAGLYCELVLDDQKNAIEYYLQAADAHHPEALIHFGIYCYNEKKYNMAIPYLKEAAELGSASAKYYLAECYLKDPAEAAADPKSAFEYLREATLQGHITAVYTLGLCYRNGLGGAPIEQQLALDNFLLAANRGYLLAFTRAAECYWERGTLEDLVIAERTLKFLVKQGDDEGKALLVKFQEEQNKKRMVTEPLEVKESEPKPTPLSNKEIEEAFNKGVEDHDSGRLTVALDHFRKAAEGGHPGAYLYLGIMHENGENVTRNVIEAKKYYGQIGKKELDWFSVPGREYFLGLKLQYADKAYEKAILKYETITHNKKLGKVMKGRALYRLGDCYVQLPLSYPHKQNPKAKAENYFEQSAATGYGPALEQVGMIAITRYGLDFPNYATFDQDCVNYRKAISKLKKGAEQGHVGSVARLGVFLYDIEINKKEIKRENFAEAVKYLSLASEYYIEAYFHLGLYHFAVTGETAKAENILKECTEKGYVEAEDALKLCQQKMNELEQLKSRNEKESKESVNLNPVVSSKNPLLAWGRGVVSKHPLTKELFPNGLAAVAEEQHRKLIGADRGTKL